MPKSILLMADFIFFNSSESVSSPSPDASSLLSRDSNSATTTWARSKLTPTVTTPFFLKVANGSLNLFFFHFAESNLTWNFFGEQLIHVFFFICFREGPFCLQN